MVIFVDVRYVICWVNGQIESHNKLKIAIRVAKEVGEPCIIYKSTDRTFGPCVYLYPQDATPLDNVVRPWYKYSLRKGRRHEHRHHDLNGIFEWEP